jgi:TPP-dependent 2-oxoacid decarboxylase
MMMAIASFLIDRMVSLAVSRICGAPGDYNLEFLKLVAVYEIDRVMQACWPEKRPAHLQLSSDMDFMRPIPATNPAGSRELLAM